MQIIDRLELDFLSEVHTLYSGILILLLCIAIATEMANTGNRQVRTSCLKSERFEQRLLAFY